MADETTGLTQSSASIDKNGIKSLCYDIQTFMQNIKKSIDNVSDFTDGYYAYYSDDTKNTFVEKKKNFMFSKDAILYNVSSYIDEYNAVVSKFENHDISTDLKTVLDEKN